MSIVGPLGSAEQEDTRLRIAIVQTGRRVVSNADGEHHPVEPANCGRLEGPLNHQVLPYGEPSSASS